MNMLDRYMKEAGWSDAWLGAQIKRHRSVVSKYRRGVVTPSLTVAVAIERLTGGRVSPSSFAAHLKAPK